MTANEKVTETDEECDNCGGPLLRLQPEPEKTADIDHDIAYICDACGAVDRYVTTEEDANDSDGN